VQFLRSVMSTLGLKKDEQSINYRERSPLVVPPDSTLPPPQAANPKLLDPAWPTDADMRRARAEAAADAKRQNMTEDEEARVLRPDELNPRTRRRGVGTDNPVGLTPEESAKPLSPSALGAAGNLFGKIFSTEKPESKPFTGEPPRTALTEPPPGYQTPSSSQPYGVNNKDTLIEDEKPMNPMDLPARGD
jgi:hypothetical protein